MTFYFYFDLIYHPALPSRCFITYHVDVIVDEDDMTTEMQTNFVSSHHNNSTVIKLRNKKLKILNVADKCLKFAQRASHTACIGADDNNNQH